MVGWIDALYAKAHLPFLRLLRGLLRTAIVTSINRSQPQMTPVGRLQGEQHIRRLITAHSEENEY